MLKLSIAQFPRAQIQAAQNLDDVDLALFTMKFKTCPTDGCKRKNKLSTNFVLSKHKRHNILPQILVSLPRKFTTYPGESYPTKHQIFENHFTSLPVFFVENVYQNFLEISLPSFRSFVGPKGQTNFFPNCFASSFF